MKIENLLICLLLSLSLLFTTSNAGSPKSITVTTHIVFDGKKTSKSGGKTSSKTTGKKHKKCTCKKTYKPVCTKSGVKFPNKCIAKCFHARTANCSKKQKKKKYHKSVGKKHMSCILKSLNPFFSRKYCTVYSKKGKKLKSVWMGRFYRTKKKTNVKQFLKCRKHKTKHKCCLHAKVCPKKKKCQIVKLKCIITYLPKRAGQHVQFMLDGEKHVLINHTFCKWKKKKQFGKKRIKFEQRRCCSFYELRNLKTIEDRGNTLKKCKWVGKKRNRSKTLKCKGRLCKAYRKWKKKLKKKKVCRVITIRKNAYRKKCCAWFLSKTKGKVVKRCTWVSKVYFSKKKPACKERQIGKYRTRLQCCVPTENGTKLCHFKGTLLKKVTNKKQAACTWIKFSSSLKKRYCCAWWYQCVGRRCSPVQRRCKYIKKMVKRWNYKEKTNYCTLSGLSPHIHMFSDIHYNIPSGTVGEWIVLKNGKKLNLVIRTRPWNHVAAISAFSLKYKNVNLEVYGHKNKIMIDGSDDDIKVGTKRKLADGYIVSRENLRRILITLDNGIKIKVRWYDLEKTLVSGSTIMNIFIYAPKDESAKLFGLCSKQSRRPSTSPFSQKIKKGNYLDTVFAKPKKPFSKHLKIVAQVSCLRRGFTNANAYSDCLIDVLNSQRLSIFSVLKSSKEVLKDFMRNTGS